MPVVILAIASVLVACSACGDDGDNPPSDSTPVVDIDNGSCGDQLRFTGEYVDWDNDASFCGINDALFEVQGGQGAMDNTAPNGRFDLCISGSGVTLLDITPPTDPSQCTVPPSAYSIGGIAVANVAMLRAGGFWSGRNFTADRAATLGVTLDPTKAHVFVHIDSGSRTVAITAAHDATQAVVDAAWAPGDTGHEVFFPNVTIGGGTTSVSATGGGVIGAGEVPLAANKITYVSLKAL
jgi:hypothetical protein